ncbi:lipoprotein insertase outer membrane protein LolB, partial [Stutzerimonas nitrititolerans]
MLLRNLLVPCLMLLLAGCAGLGPRESVEGSGNSQDWATHKEQVSEIDGWQISGKIGIRAPQESGSGTLFWLQRQEYFDIRLSGPLGRGATRLTGRPDAVALE